MFNIGDLIPASFRNLFYTASYRYFSDKGDPDLGGIENMDPSFMKFLDNFRHQLGHPIHIHAGYATSGHSPNSQHYKGLAVDCSCPSLTLRDFYNAACNFQYYRRGFGAIGVYPYWNRQGLHLDFRKIGIKWIRDSRGKYVYDFSLSELESYLRVRQLDTNQLDFLNEVDSFCDH